MARLDREPAILQYVADHFPKAASGPGPGMARSRLHQWLASSAPELHKGLFRAAVDKRRRGGEKLRAGEEPWSRLDYLESYLKDREYLLDHFSVADAYLVTSSTGPWATPPVELAKWPVVRPITSGLRARPRSRKADRAR